MKSKISNFISKLNYVNLKFYHNLTSEELNMLFNKTKINLLFSGRDSCPRIISESMVGGCYNLALDTLSDGKFYYDGVCGQLIGNENFNVTIKNRMSLSYVNNNKLWKNISDINKQQFDHKMISTLSNNKYNINSVIKNILKFF